MDGNYLKKIIEYKKRIAAEDTRNIKDLKLKALSSPSNKKLSSALTSARKGGRWQPAIIAEIKRRSPSQGPLNYYRTTAELASAYTRGGATALSVVTDNKFFGGNPGDISAARNVSELPILRKDFILTERDILDTRIIGADATLLIALALPLSEMKALSEVAKEIGVECLIEIHSEAELEKALAMQAEIISVNQRNLNTFEIDYEIASTLSSQIPDDVISIVASGIDNTEDLKNASSQGYNAILVGEALCKSYHPTRKLLEWLETDI